MFNYNCDFLFVCMCVSVLRGEVLLLFRAQAGARVFK